MINRIKKLLGFYTWVTIESRMAAYTISHGLQGGFKQEFVFYNIDYSYFFDQYRLVAIGDRAEEHVIYGEMLKRLAAFNNGTVTEPNSTDDGEVINKGEVQIINIPIDTTASEVFKYVRDDYELIKATTNFARGFKEGGGEIFKQDKNILATNEGYFGSFYKEELDFNEQEDNEDYED